jgi:hypothetical protein
MEKSYFLSLILADYRNKLKTAPLLLVAHDADRGYVYEGRKYAQLVDSLQERLLSRGIDCMTVASPYSTFVGPKAFGHVVSANTSFAVCALKEKIGAFVGGNNSTGYCVSKSRVWRTILKTVQPKAVIGNYPSPDLCHACHQEKVWVADLQHGVITDEDPWYGWKFGTSRDSAILPDCYLCWDEPSAETLRKWASLKKIDVRVIGNPWFLRFADPVASDPLVKQALDVLPSPVRHELPTILISLQWGMDRILDEIGLAHNSVMPDALVKVILDTAKRYNWLIRLHPIQLAGEKHRRITRFLGRLFGDLSTVEWEVCSTMPLPLLLKHVDLHVTLHSSVTTEAGWFGVPTALLNPQIGPGGRWESMYLDERRAGLARVVACEPEEIAKWIGQSLTGSGGAFQPLTEKAGLYHSFIDDLAAFLSDREDSLNPPFGDRLRA